MLKKTYLSYNINNNKNPFSDKAWTDQWLHPERWGRDYSSLCLSVSTGASLRRPEGPGPSPPPAATLGTFETGGFRSF